MFLIIVIDPERRVIISTDRFLFQEESLPIENGSSLYE